MLRFRLFLLAATLFWSAHAPAQGTQPVASPSNASDLSYASVLIEDGLYDAALLSLRASSLSSDEEVGRVFLEMAKLYAALGNIARAQDSVEQAQSLLAGHTPRLQIEQARLHIMVGNLVHARQRLEALGRATNLTTEEREDLILLRAKAQLAVGGVDSAVDLLSSNQNAERLAIESAKLYVSQDEFDQASRVLRAYVTRFEGAGRAWLKLGEVSRLAGDAKESDEALRKAERIFVAQKDEPRRREVARVRAMPVSLVTQRATPPAAPIQPPQAPPAAKPEPTEPPVAALTPPPPPPAPPPPVAQRPSVPPSPPPALAPEAYQIVARPFPFHPTLTGSGFVIDSGRRVVTNRHVVEKSTEIYVRNSLGNLSRARIEKLSSTDDLAVLALDTHFPRNRSISPAQFAPARTGASIAVIGFPLTDILGSVTPSITNGIVIKDTGMQDAASMFQLSAKMNKGNSGGAVVDSTGRIVGVAMGKLDLVKIMQGDGFLPEDINFAVHVNRLTPLGVSVQPAQAGHLPQKSLEEIYQSFIGSVVLIVTR